MIPDLLFRLGVNPKGNGKTGKREAAWTLMLIALALTAVYIVVVWFKPGIWSGLRDVVMLAWGAAVGAVMYAYKMENDNKRLSLDQTAPPAGNSDAPEAPPGAAG